MKEWKIIQESFNRDGPCSQPELEVLLLRGAVRSPASSTQPQGTPPGASEAAWGPRAPGQTLHLALSSPARGHTAHGPRDRPQGLPVFSFAANPHRPPGYALRSCPSSRACHFGAPPLPPRDWSAGLLVFCQSSNSRLAPGPHLPAPRTLRDHLWE